MSRLFNRLHLIFSPSMVLSAIAIVLAAGGGAYAAAASSSNPIAACVHHKGGGLYLAHKCGGRDGRLQWSVTGPAGPQGPQGQPGPIGKTGDPGPGAIEYTYNSTAPAATDQNSPLGPAGPFSQLTGSCTVFGGIVEVTLGAANPLIVRYDETRLDETNGGALNTWFTSGMQPASPSPVDLVGEANTTNIGDGYNHTTMTVTDPVHGQLDVYEHVSHANNTCHISVMWTPAS